MVVAIIALLLTIMAPSLTRAKELARRAVCGTNLHNCGQAALAFVSDNDGLFPRTGGANVVGHQVRPQIVLRAFPRVTHRSVADSEFGDHPFPENNPRVWAPTWRGHGTTLATWAQYGFGLSAMDCPSTDYVPVEDEEGNGYPGWYGIGKRVLMDYLIISGVYPRDEHGGSYGYPGGYSYMGEINWTADKDPDDGIADPAYSTADASPGPSKRIIAADRIEWRVPLYGGDLDGWMHSNHDADATDDHPTFQQILYADGSVRPIGRDVYKIPIDPLNWSNMAPGGTGDRSAGRYRRLYWGQ